MKIAIICPIGDVQRFGYWRSAQPCLESWRALGDLFLIHSSRAALPFSISGEYIRDERTLMQIIDGREWFDHRLVASNANRGIALARAAGYDVAITICVNWYIEQAAARQIENNCLWMCYDKGGFCFLFRRIQIGAHLFDADLKSIALFNLHVARGNIVKVLVDRADINGLEMTGVRGSYSALNDEAYIDCEHELTIDELKEKLSDVRNYAEILPKRSGVAWDYWERYYRERAQSMSLSGDAPGPIGQSIAALHPAGAFGDWLMSQMADTA